MSAFNSVPFVLFVLLSIAPTAAADRDFLEQFGMLGRQAVDCSAPYSSTNPHVIFAVSPEGKATRTLKMDPDLDGTFPMRKLRLLTPNLLQFEETGRSGEFTITINKIDGKFRSWHSMRGDGTVFIEDGKFSRSGKPTPTFEFCGQ